MNKHELGHHNAKEQIKLTRQLAAIREKRGITLAEVAEKMDIHMDDLIHFEKGGANFTAGMVRQYARIVGAQLMLSAEANDDTDG